MNSTLAASFSIRVQNYPSNNHINHSINQSINRGFKLRELYTSSQILNTSLDLSLYNNQSIDHTIRIALWPHHNLTMTILSWDWLTRVYTLQIKLFLTYPRFSNLVNMAPSNQMKLSPFHRLLLLVIHWFAPDILRGYQS